MAISITQQPTTPNAAYTSLPYVVSGSVTTGNPQYSYVMDIYESGSATRLNRVSQKPNPAGVAVFDPSRFLQSQLQYDNHWKITGSIDEVNSVKTFEIKFGEQYGTSTSSSITVYPNLATDELEVFPAVVDPNNGSSYNFNTSSYVGIGNTYLTNFPGSQTTTTISDPNGYPYIVDSSDYMTVTAFKEDVGATGSINVNGYKIETGSISALVDTVSLSGSLSDEFVTFGVGPKNLSDLDSAFSASIANGSINTLVTTSDNGGITIMINNKWDGSNIIHYDYSKTVQPRGTEYTRFAFINKFGFYDYYNVYNPLKRNSNVERQNVTLPKLDYSNLTSIYSQESRGETSYYNDISDSYSITTQWLDKDIANWVEELLESPEVYIQQGNDFVPVVITDATYTSNQSTARNKLFEYNINFKPANGNDLYSRETNCPPQPPVYVPVDPTPPVQDWKSWTLASGSDICNLCLETPAQTFYTVHTVDRLDVGIEVYSSSSLVPAYQLSNVNLTDGAKVYQIPAGNDQHITQIAFCDWQLVHRCSDGAIRRLADCDFTYPQDTRLYSSSDCTYWYASGSTDDKNIPILNGLTVVSGSGCPAFGNTPFDPTLCGELTLNHWYDFQDESVMTLSGSGNQITYLLDKGNAATTSSLTTDSDGVGTSTVNPPYYTSQQQGAYLYNPSGSLYNSGLKAETFVNTLWGQSGGQRTFVTIFRPKTINNVVEPYVAFSDQGGIGPSFFWPAAVMSSSAGLGTFDGEVYTMQSTSTSSGEFYAGAFGEKPTSPEPFDSAGILWQHVGEDTYDYFVATTAADNGFGAMTFQTIVKGYGSDTLQGGVATLSGNPGTGYQGFQVGYPKAGTTGTNNPDGYIKQVLVYNGLLTNTQIEDLRQAYLLSDRGPGVEQPAGCYKLRGRTSGTISGSCCTASVVDIYSNSPVLTTGSLIFAQPNLSPPDAPEYCSYQFSPSRYISLTGSSEYWYWNRDSGSLSGPFNCPDCP